MMKIIKKSLIVIMAFLSIVSIVGMIYIFSQSKELLGVIEKYNVVVKEYNAIVEKYNFSIKNSSVENIEGMYSELGTLAIEDESIWSAIKVYLGPNSKAKIENDIKTIEELISTVNECNLIVQQITMPNEEWVVNRLKSIEEVKGVQCVTEENDPEGLLNSTGGYKACVYFAVDGLDITQIPGKTIVEKGTDCGGAIEIYESAEAAKERCKYLQGFDGTILYSGSYAVIGTMVVRTSYLLSENDQLYLTNKIFESFTNLEEQTENVRNEVKKIDAYYFTSAGLVFKKEVIDFDEIEMICEKIERIEYEENDSLIVVSPVGSATIYFDFHFHDGSVERMEFVFSGKYVERLTIDDVEYRVTGESIAPLDLWNSLSPESYQIDEKIFQ